jgi:hypothetical protein
MRIRLRAIVALSALVSFAQRDAVAECLYLDPSGIYRTVASEDLVPPEFSAIAKCSRPREGTSIKSAPSPALHTASPAQNSTPPHNYTGSYTVNEYGEALKSSDNQVTRPDEVVLNGNIREMKISTSLGDVQLRWPRSVEDLFGKNPDKAVRDAWAAGARVLSQQSFPSRLRSAKYQWNVVFMDEVPASVMPSLSGSCHPAWMRPPADIFVSASSVASNCSPEFKSPKEANALLARALVHELGHAVEFQLADKGFPFLERWNSEGFATWFETHAGQSFVGRDKVYNRSMFREQAKEQLTPNWRPSAFNGSSEDYMRSYALISVIADGRSLSRLTDLYLRMAREQISLTVAVKRELGWDEGQWVAEARRYLGAK